MLLKTTDDNGATAGIFTLPVKLHVNGKQYALQLDPRTSLLDALREHIGLTGSKKGCNQGACGACTVIANGERINACLALALQYEGAEITTVEGLAGDEALNSLQAAFIQHDGFQCGYCTPGQLCSATAMLDEFRSGMPSAVSTDVGRESFEFSEQEIKERMSGNLCRCGAYNGIVDAIMQTYQNNKTVKAHDTVYLYPGR